MSCKSNSVCTYLLEAFLADMTSDATITCDLQEEATQLTWTRESIGCSVVNITQLIEIPLSLSFVSHMLLRHVSHGLLLVYSIIVRFQVLVIIKRIFFTLSYDTSNFAKNWPNFTRPCSIACNAMPTYCM